MKTYDVLIIGGGPSGLTAALYLLRAGASVLLIEKEAIGGQMAKSPLIENYPGLKGSGNVIADKLFATLNEFSNFQFALDTIDNLQYNGIDEKAHWIASGEFANYASKYVILSLGATPYTLNVPGSNANYVHYCATCDGPLYKDKTVAVIGDGNSAMQYALELSRYCSSVYICTLGDCFFGEKVLEDRIYASDNIVVLNNFNIALISDNTVVSDKNMSVKADGIFIAIGQKPNTDFVKDVVSMDEYGYIITDENMYAGQGIYAVGDCRWKDVRQVLTAMSDGVIAAVNIVKKL